MRSVNKASETECGVPRSAATLPSASGFGNLHGWPAVPLPKGGTASTSKELCTHCIMENQMEKKMENEMETGII